MASIQNYLVLLAIGLNRPDIISELSRTCWQCGCNLLNTKSNLLGEDLAIVMFLSGNWGAIAKMETALSSLEQKLGLSIQARRTQEPSFMGQSMPYTIQLVAIDRTGILTEISDFLLEHGVQTEELSSHTYVIHPGTRMASLHFKINIPEKVHLATLREEFMSYCDDKNLEGFMEPLRP
ncbi:MAG TPA: ACT domain-containing protein [Gammaproteobacteria bacterium]|nr:ACT domain-containing protein [Gammaproteobacteria bacterium]